MVEGFTEFLPVSSTAHLILTAHVLGLSQTALVKTFEIAIQSGAIVAVLCVYWKKFLDKAIFLKVLAAFIPTAIIGLALYKVAKEYFLDNIPLTLWALALGGAVLIIFELFFNRKQLGPENCDPNQDQSIRSMSYWKVALIGLFQALAIIPGVSRSAATIVAGRLLGMNRAAIVEFSFLLAVPTILAATGLDLVKNIHLFTAHDSGLVLIGFISSFVFALISIRFLLAYIRKHSFIEFGIYRILLVVVFVVFFFTR
jgi:undecaprenyl-diphosphatase